MKPFSIVLVALGMAAPWATSHATRAPEAVTAIAPAAPDPAADGSASASGNSPPHNLSDLSGWLEYKSRTHTASLPLEARIFYRRGLFVHETGMADEGARWVRGAAELDPAYVAPHLTLAAWSVFREPSQALLQYATVLELARRNFLFQLTLLGNAVYAGFEALVIALLACGLLVVVLRSAEFRHPWGEKLSGFVSPASARGWSWAILMLPYAVGLGLALPTVALLGMLWPSLRARERALFVALTVALASVPWVAAGLDRLAAPIDESRAPLYGVPLLEGDQWTPEREARLRDTVKEHPDNPFLLFGLGWAARHGGDLATAEASYRHALEVWPNDDRVLNNLGNVLAMQGRLPDALELFQRAIAANASNAAAYYNSSQIYTQRFEYRPATDALSRASALDFDMVKTYQSQPTEDGSLPLVDLWLAPRTCWLALSREPNLAQGGHSLPPAWRNRIEASGPWFSLAIVVIALIGLGLGIREHRAMPLRACTNCEAIVCRRCAQRRRELALCPTCAALEARAESPDFARVLLLQHQRQLRGRRDALRTALASLIPGFGLLSFRRVFTPLALLVTSVLLAGNLLRATLPFAFEPRLAMAEHVLPLPATLACWALVYVVSLLGYLEQSSRARAEAASQAAPVRSRTAQPGRRIAAAA